LTIERIWSAIETTLFYYSDDSTTGQVCLKKRDKKCEFNCEARSCAFVYFEQKHKQNKQKRIREKNYDFPDKQKKRMKSKQVKKKTKEKKSRVRRS